MAKILLVEDYENLQKIYKTALEHAHHTVRLADDGNEGLKLARQERFDLILLDLLMPNMDGIGFLRIFAASKHPETKVIIMSNIMSTELLNEALKLGASQYLLKANTTPQYLTEIVHQSLTDSKN